MLCLDGERNKVISEGGANLLAAGDVTNLGDDLVTQQPFIFTRTLWILERAKESRERTRLIPGEFTDITFSAVLLLG